jgi:hypothetical protein
LVGSSTSALILHDATVGTSGIKGSLLSLHRRVDEETLMTRDDPGFML